MPTRFPKLKKFARWSLTGLAVVVVALVLAVVVLERRTFEAPLPDIHASTDPAVIARGRYLAYGPAHCVDCHGAQELAMARKPGSTEEIPLIGGGEFHLPIGTIRAPNITSDPETGIGKMTDAELARSLRYGVSRHGNALVPFMPFANLSDEDLTAVISFLRTQEPVRHEVVTRELNALGRMINAFVLKPSGPTGEPVKSVPNGTPTVERGEYLVNAVANCAGCHTDRNPMTGAFVAPPLSGGMPMESHSVPGLVMTPPNLTPDPKTGRMSGWSEDTFVARLKSGAGAPGSPMPWVSFSTMDENDLRAIYRYLKTVPAVEHAVPAPKGPPVAKR